MQYIEQSLSISKGFSFLFKLAKNGKLLLLMLVFY